MTRGDLTWSVLGRPLKPVGLAVMVGMFVTAVEALDSDAAIGHGLWAAIVAAVALVAALLLLLGWVLRHQRLAEHGLLIAFAVWIARVVLYHQTHPFWDRYFLAACWALVAGGAYLLEVSDPNGENERRDQ